MKRETRSLWPILLMALASCQGAKESPQDGAAPDLASSGADGAAGGGGRDLATPVEPERDLAMSVDPRDMAMMTAGDMAEPGGDNRDLSSGRDLGGGADLAMGRPGNDPFGVKMLAPTKAGGREWFLPATADKADAEWQPGIVITKVSPGVFHVSGAPRMMVVSPAGKAWWRNVEMTSYVRQTGTVNVYQDQEPHWTMFARGERHANNNIAPASINLGNPAPMGTVTWPGYPWNGLASINNACLSTCYHALFYPTGKMILEKEITHTEGYGARNAGQLTLGGFQPALNRWFGAKFLLRDMSGDKAVKLELWVDKNGDRNWVKATEASDTGNWAAGNANLNGCAGAPTRYGVNQVVTWAGPWAAFRVDNLAYDFKWLSVREVDPLP